MHRKRPSPSATAVLAIPLLLCLQNTLVSAFGIYDYFHSSLGVGSRSGGSLVRRDELSQVGFYNPLNYGGYMMTVSFPCFPPTPLHRSLAGWILPFPGYGYLTPRDDAGFNY